MAKFKQLIVLYLACSLLNACIGGPIAQQIASSIALKAADKVTANAIDAYDQKQEEESKKMVFKNTEPDEYQVAFLTSNFSDTAIDHTSYNNPNKDYRQASYQNPNPNTKTNVKPILINVNQNNPQMMPNVQVEASRLVQVEIWNIIIGQEKMTLMQRAAQLGSGNVPILATDWQKWQMATGNISSNDGKTIYFLVPPDLGKIKSGERAFVEIAEVGGLHIARYLTH